MTRPKVYVEQKEETFGGPPNKQKCRWIRYFVHRVAVSVRDVGEREALNLVGFSGGQLCVEDARNEPTTDGPTERRTKLTYHNLNSCNLLPNRSRAVSGPMQANGANNPMIKPVSGTATTERILWWASGSRATFIYTVLQFYDRRKITVRLQDVYLLQKKKKNLWAFRFRMHIHIFLISGDFLLLLPN